MSTAGGMPFAESRASPTAVGLFQSWSANSLLSGPPQFRDHCQSSNSTQREIRETRGPSDPAGTFESYERAMNMMTLSDTQLVAEVARLALRAWRHGAAHR